MIELLAPAGDSESLIAAVINGANAVYLGGTLFSARASAKNFTNDELIWAVNYAHEHDVQVFVTLNTIAYEKEIDSIMEYINFLYQNQVDAVILQDIGLIHLVRNHFPDFAIHVSTQASVFNAFGAKYFEDLGVERVVLARENTLEEIKDIVENTSIEIEVFVHGAMCVCYSGQCLMSQMIGKRSGNRGACAQPCRLTYQLLEDDVHLSNDHPYLLSPKDMMTIEHVGELIDLGVHSLKIEGRMKKPEYVASVIKSYRKAIDSHQKQVNVELTQDIHDMKAVFNREYTTGYIFKSKSIVNGDFSGNKGQLVGCVLSYNKRNKRVKIKLSESIQQEDFIIFENIDKGRPINKMYKNDLLVSSANPGDTIEIEFDQLIDEGNVRRTHSVLLSKSLKLTYQKEQQRLPLSIHFKGSIGRVASLEVQYKDNSILVESDIVCEKAQNTPLSKERLSLQLSKWGGTQFFANDIKIDMSKDMIIPIKVINELRRDAYAQLCTVMKNKYTNRKNVDIKDIILNPSVHKDVRNFVVVHNCEQLVHIQNTSNVTVFYLYQEDIETARTYAKENDMKFGIYTPRITDRKLLLEMRTYVDACGIEDVMVNDIGAYALFSDLNVVVNSTFNLVNSYAFNALNGYKVPSMELTTKDIMDIKCEKSQIVIPLYTKVENMISAYCPVTQHYHGKQIKSCQKCKDHKYRLVDRKDVAFDIMLDEQCMMHILHNKPLTQYDPSIFNEYSRLIIFTNEEKDEVIALTNRLLS